MLRGHHWGGDDLFSEWLGEDYEPLDIADNFVEYKALESDISKDKESKNSLQLENNNCKEFENELQN